MYALVATLVMVLLVLILLFPESAQELLMARTPLELRPDLNRVEMRIVATVAIFVFSFAMFQGWDRLLHRGTPHWIDPVGIRFAEASAAVFLILGLAGCIFSSQVVERVGPRFGDTSGTAPAFVIAVQLFGVTCLLVAVQLFRHASQ